MSKPRRTRPLFDKNSAAATPNYPSRVEMLASDKAVLHEMRVKLGTQQNMITAMRREMKKLQTTVKLLQTVEIPKPVEQSKSVAMKLRPNGRAE